MERRTKPPPQTPSHRRRQPCGASTSSICHREKREARRGDPSERRFQLDRPPLLAMTNVLGCSPYLASLNRLHAPARRESAEACIVHWLGPRARPLERTGRADTKAHRRRRAARCERIEEYFHAIVVALDMTW